MIFREAFAALMLILYASIFGLAIRLIGTNKHRPADATDVLAGLAFMGIIFHFFGTIGILYQAGLLVAPLLFLFNFKSFAHQVCILKFNFWRKSRDIRIDPLKSLCFVALTTFGLTPIVYIALHHANSYDALAYQMYAPLHALFKSHSFNANDLIPNSGLPVGAGALHGWIVAFGAKAELGTLTVVIVCLIVWILRDKQDFFAVWIIKVFVTLSLIYAFGVDMYGSINSDLVLLLFVLGVSTKSVSNEEKPIEPSTLLILSFIPLIKPFAMIFCLSFVFIQGMNQKLGFQKLIQSGVLISTPYLAWCLKNYLQVRNPFLPMFQNFFGGPGFGPEVMSLESDVRRSFSQFNFVINQLIADPIMAMKIYSNWLVLPLVVVFLLIKILIDRKKFFENNINLLFIVSIAVNILIAGPVGRYTSFGVIGLAAGFISEVGLNSQRRMTKIRFGKQVTFISSFVVAAALLGSSNYIKFFRDHQMFSMRDDQIISIQSVTEKVVGKDDTICLIGDGRALLFFPRNVVVFDNDRRNPFDFQSKRVNAEINSTFMRYKCAFVYINTGWGFPENIDVKSIEQWMFDEKQKGKQIIANQVWNSFEIAE